MEEGIGKSNHQAAPGILKRKNKKEVVQKAKENNTKTISLKIKKVIKS